MASVPKGFHRINFNCPEALYLVIKDAAHGNGQAISKFMLAAINDKLLAIASAGTEVLDLPEELQMLLGKPVATGEVSLHEEDLDLPERLR